MIRVISLPKAITAGLAGAAVMEVFSFALRAVGLPSVDFVRDLSAIAFSHSPVLTTASALLAHLSIGVCWAIFYAFFFWGRIKARPLVQGLLFSLLPAALAILIVYPELALIPGLLLLAILTGILPAVAAYRVDVSRITAGTRW